MDHESFNRRKNFRYAGRAVTGEVTGGWLRSWQEEGGGGGGGGWQERGWAC